MDLLKRELAPILPAAWAMIDDEAKRALFAQLAGRKVVDFDGPHGFGFAAVNTGRVEPIASSDPANLVACIRQVVPLVELSAPIVLAIRELDAVGRGGDNPDLAAVVDASERVAHFEDDAIFNGNDKAGIQGIIPASPHAKIRVSSAKAWPIAIARAKEVLKGAGVGGPYALAAGKRAYDDLSGGSDEGYPSESMSSKSSAMDGSSGRRPSMALSSFPSAATTIASRSARICRSAIRTRSATR